MANTFQLDGGHGEKDITKASLGGQPEKMKWDTRPRRMENGDISVPFSMAFVIKQLLNFEPKHVNVQCKMTLIMRVKCSGLNELLYNPEGTKDEDMVTQEKVMQFIENDLKYRINEDECPLKTEKGEHEGSRYVRQNRAKSKDYNAEVDPKLGDICQFTIRASERMYTEFASFVNFPFDQLTFAYRFEVSHFEKGKNVIRFDFYHQSDNEIGFKEGVDSLPEMDVDFAGTQIDYIEEKKTKKDSKTGEKIDCYYYPGFILKIKLVRDPLSKSLTYFLTSMILGGFLIATFDVVEFKDRLANLSICLLAFINILQNMRDGLPEIHHLTFRSRFVITYLSACIMPVFDTMLVGHVDMDKETDLRLFIKRATGGVMIIAFFVMAYRYYQQRSFLNQTIPKQEKAKGQRGKPDESWTGPHWKPKK